VITGFRLTQDPCDRFGLGRDFVRTDGLDGRQHRAMGLRLSSE
jgi:hypothetical protein